MAPTLIILALLALAVGIVVWVVRRKPSSTVTGPRETDTAWNDPVTPRESLPADPPAPASSTEEHRP
ncbi:MAG: hypothetical protein Q8R45_14165 [Brevundimonas sp.]|uniref:hypothetical protein n=1 Tax=Brevundimonas sp. TaxID=1871086 RepID=UPI0027275DC7|nr:hypothetical protein [Brevundimonas sp.]MDZ4320791.1 hypothetical protein [Phenylobacterium sp.]MDO9586590.1 hypothetical protein [Brevundimonas sp.]MDP3370970.1 hypothetical protein [Brevundimonas sp.]MDP3658094.1 hypothetical protein [Brevundimonas sp.]MDZ4112202.1 hypothetical protein [Brevundimonas sp.]